MLISAFLLHQVAEQLYTAVLLVFTRYNPKTHNLEILQKLVNALDPRFVEIFPLIQSEDRRRFELLRKAYIDSRYKKGYEAGEELCWLAAQLKELEQVSRVLCQKKMDSFLTKLQSYKVTKKQKRIKL